MHISYAIAEMQMANSVNMTDASVKLERFFKQLLNAMRDSKLISANLDICNFWAIDLKDVDKRVCWQITATNTLEKFRHTLNKFKAKEMSQDYDELHFLILIHDDPRTLKDKELEGLGNTKVFIHTVKSLYKDIDGIDDEGRISNIHHVVSKELPFPEKEGVLPAIEEADINLPSVQRIIDAMNFRETDFALKKSVENDMTALAKKIEKLKPEQKNVIFKYMVHCSFKTNRRGTELPDDIYMTNNDVNNEFDHDERSCLKSLKSKGLLSYQEEYWIDDEEYSSVLILTFKGELDATNLFGWLKMIVKGDETKMREMFCMGNYKCLSI